MSGGHTPGPWNVQPDSLLFAKIGSQGNGGIYVAKVQGPDADANARLIAAAPELVEAVGDLLSGWRYIRAMHGDLPGVGWDRAEEIAVAAIAKATGETL